MSKIGFVVLALAWSSARAHPAFFNNPNLNPVHSLYVKPSGDGSTGDLYVAATEENGVKTQWLTDQPVSFLPAQHALQSYPFGPSLPMALPHDESVSPQKRAVVTNPAFNFAYALPAATSSDGNVVSYPYATPVPTAQPTKECSDAPVAPMYPQYQYQSPFQYYYPHMMSAFASAINELKEAGVSDEDANSLISQIMPKTAAPVWPSTYAYPVQYVMVDPASWAQSQAAAMATTTQSTTPASTVTPASTTSSEETV